MFFCQMGMKGKKWKKESNMLKTNTKQRQANYYKTSIFSYLMYLTNIYLFILIEAYIFLGYNLFFQTT